VASELIAIRARRSDRLRRRRPVRRFVALGDSTTVGLGDPLPDGTWRGWAALLAAGLGCGSGYVNLARTGARVADLAEEQLPTALELRPDVAAVIVGMNDTLRSDFHVERLRDDLCRVAGALTDAGTTLLTVRMHDHGRVFHLPGPLRRALRRRIDMLNEVYDEVVVRYGALCVDLDADPATYHSASWSVDRLHPGERGHRRLARSFAELLLAEGYAVPLLPGLEPVGGAVATRRAHAWWLVSQGAPWMWRRGRDLLPHATALALREVVPRRRSAVPVMPGQRPDRPALGSPACLEPTDEPLTNFAQ
jgi:lysophospholipase L1-like esterase